MRRVLLSLVFVALATPALAVDGVLEINQTCAVETGCFSGDTLGFPVTISQSGSYRLTSDLDVSGEPAAIDQTGIVTGTDHVWLDLNGFSLIGPLGCEGTPPGAVGLGDGIRSTGANTVVINGSVAGLGRNGVSLGDGSRVERVTVGCSGATGIEVGARAVVERCAVSQSGGDGIRAGSLSVVNDNRSVDNVGFGLDIGERAAYGGNMVSGNNGGSSILQVSASDGAFQLGVNVCQTATECPVGPVCGDGSTDGMEGCDDGNQDNTDSCPDGTGGTCQVAVCGDGFLWIGGGEICDDGNQDDTDSCVGCMTAFCGDGFCGFQVGENNSTCPADCP